MSATTAANVEASDAAAAAVGSGEAVVVRQCE
jgi:hypothetical protein